MEPNTPEKIIAKLVRNPNGCWEWHGKKIWNGYGQVKMRGKPMLVHRLVYEHLVGPIPTGFDLHHCCENRACAEPAHLEPLSRKEHPRRGRTIIAAALAKTHCDRGHDSWVVRTDKRGRSRRVCQECARARNRKYEERCRREAGVFVRYTTTHCRQGHPYAAQGLARGLKRCMVCQAKAAREARRRAKQHQ